MVSTTNISRNPSCSLLRKIGATDRRRAHGAHKPAIYPPVVYLELWPVEREKLTAVLDDVESNPTCELRKPNFYPRFHSRCQPISGRRLVSQSSKSIELSWRNRRTGFRDKTVFRARSPSVSNFPREWMNPLIIFPKTEREFSRDGKRSSRCVVPFAVCQFWFSVGPR